MNFLEERKRKALLNAQAAMLFREEAKRCECEAARHQKEAEELKKSLQ